MKNRKNQYETGDVLTICYGFGVDDASAISSNKPIQKITVDEARKILNESLGGKELYEYTRQERNER